MILEQLQFVVISTRLEFCFITRGVELWCLVEAIPISALSALVSTLKLKIIMDVKPHVMADVDCVEGQRMAVWISMLLANYIVHGGLLG